MSWLIVRIVIAFLVGYWFGWRCSKERHMRDGYELGIEDAGEPAAYIFLNQKH